MNDFYTTIANPSTGEYKDQGSKFLAWAFQVNCEEEINTHLEAIKKEHPKARHHCFAWRLGLIGDSYRAFDDGEPSGTAGRPILGQIDCFGLTNCLVVVVRYFGGTLLGTSGLINAYKSAARAALERAKKVTIYLEEKIRIDFDYSIMGELINALMQAQVKILEQNFDEKPYMIIAIRKSLVEEQLSNVIATVFKISLEEARAKREFPTLKIHHPLL